MFYQFFPVAVVYSGCGLMPSACLSVFYQGKPSVLVRPRTNFDEEKECAWQEPAHILLPVSTLTKFRLSTRNNNTTKYDILHLCYLWTTQRFVSRNANLGVKDVWHCYTMGLYQTISCNYPLEIVHYSPMSFYLPLAWTLLFPSRASVTA